MGRYLEDFNVGDVFVTRGRTVTEADIMQYAGLCWDTQAEHTDAEFARRGPFGGRIAQQQLGLLIAHGLIGSLDLLDGTLVSVLRLGWNFFNPIKIGDTLHVKQTVTGKRDLAIDDGGVVTFQIETSNQREEFVNRCQRTVLVARRPQARSEARTTRYTFLTLSGLEGQVDDPHVSTLVVKPESSKAQVVPAHADRPHRAGEQKRGKYFEEFEIGEELTTQSRTVAEADAINYTILSWDTEPLHTDAEYGRAMSYGGMLAPLLLPIVFANGLGATLGFLAGTNRGALGDWWEFARPVRVGDTLHFRQVIAAKQDAKDPETGIVTFGMEMVNERGEVVSRGERSALVLRQPGAKEEATPWKFAFGTTEDLAKTQE
jgi:acyl dehydratase